MWSFLPLAADYPHHPLSSFLNPSSITTVALFFPDVLVTVTPGLQGRGVSQTHH